MREELVVGRSPAGQGARVSDGTKARIMDAALETLKREGIVGTSARAIAQTGGFAPGVLFYHFGSVGDVLLAAVEQLSRQRVDRYAKRLEGVETLAELVAVARALHREDVEEGHIRVLSQMLAATASDPDLGAELQRIFEPWIALVHQTLDRVVGGSPVRSLVPTDDGAYALTALFLGLELLTHLGGDFARDERLFDAFDRVAQVFGPLLGLAGPPRPPAEQA
jgi:AcrR family transcriptional regulator